MAISPQADRRAAEESSPRVAVAEKKGSGKRKVHLTLQGKGGVGKSLVSCFVAQRYLRDGGAEQLVCIDTDPVNKTLASYRALRAERLELLQGNEVKQRRFDQLMERVLTEDRNFVVDNGASSFLPLVSYLVQTKALDMISAAGKKVVVHTVLVGGQALLDTLHGFDSLAQQLPAHVELVVWLNEFFGPVMSPPPESKPFEEMLVYEQHRKRITTLVKLEAPGSEMFEEDLRVMLERKLTFAEAADQVDFSIMTRQRLLQIERPLFEQLARVV